MSGFFIPSYLDKSNGTANFQALADSFTRNGPIRFKPISGDYTAVPDDSDVVLRCDDTTEVKIPADVFGQRNFPPGAQIGVLNYSEKRVVIEPAEGVTINGPERLSVDRWRVGVLVKQNANLWLLSLGNMGGGDAKGVPLPPKITKATGVHGGVELEWSAPVDDGGSPITQYIVEQSQDEKDWSSAGVTDGHTLTLLVTKVPPSVKCYFRVKAVNANGVSDPSNVADATPEKPFNDAEGGAVSTYTKDGKKFKVHTFTDNSTLIVKSALLPFRILAVGAGAGRSGGNPSCCGGTSCQRGPSPGGGGNNYLNDNDTLDSQSYPVAVGFGGNRGPDGCCDAGSCGCCPGGGGKAGASGGPSSIAGKVGAGGTGIAQGGTAPNHYVTTDINGTSKQYGANGGGDQGGRGIVIVSYEIDPAVTEFDEGEVPVELPIHDTVVYPDGSTWTLRGTEYVHEESPEIAEVEAIVKGAKRANRKRGS